ncbi:MAG: hypothetical protein GX569_08365, partial [Candidatus Riflebacteria bacterium]|nr:hypothetical protein [Candidatus Riflebacteria bacterium]
MQHIKQIRVFSIVVFMLLISTVVGATPFVHVAGTWGHADEENRRDQVYVTQGTNGKILSLSGYVYYYYDWNYFTRSSNWVCNDPDTNFLWDLRLTERSGMYIYRDGPFWATCTVSFSASNASAATYAISGPVLANDGNYIGAYTNATGSLIRLSVDALVDNGPPPQEQPDAPVLPFRFVGAGDFDGPKDPINDKPPREPEDCPPSQGQLQTKLPGNPGSMSVSDPVNIVSGNFFMSETDLRLKSRLALSLIRNYNSLDKSVTAFGRGWSTPFTVCLLISESGVAFKNSDGAALVFEKDGENYITPEGHDVNLSRMADTGLWRVAVPRGSEWYFDENGRIVRMVQACCGAGASDAIDFEYDTNGNLTRVINPAGQWMQFTSSDGLITSASDSSGRSVSYEYTTSKDLVKFTDPVGRITTYSYDDDGFMTLVVKPGNITTSLEYDNGKVTKITNPDQSINILTWNETAKQMTLTDGMGVDYLYSFDHDWRLASYSVPAIRLTKTISFAGETVSGTVDSLGHASSYQYGEDGYLANITDKTGFNTAYTWHPTLKKLAGKTDALGRNWSYMWCARGNLIRKTDPAGNVTAYTYDSHNNRT